MGIIDKLSGSFGLSKSLDIEEYMDTVEMEEVDVLHDPADHYVIPIALEKADDARAITAEIKKGNLVLLNITRMSKFPKKLKKVVSSLKEYVTKNGGDIARIDNDKIILTPSKIKVIKKIKKGRRR